MDQPLAERRRHARFCRAALSALRATLRPGCQVSVVDLSAGGVLVDAPRPLRPGAWVHLQMAHGDRTIAMAAQILRCTVSAVDPEHGVVYRGALRFDKPCTLLREAQTHDGSAVPGPPAASTPSHGQTIPARILFGRAPWADVTK